MKYELNIEINTAKKYGVVIDEIFLFREMAKQFNTAFSRCTYVNEIHKKLVSFDSYYKGAKAHCELGDLLFLTFDKKKKELRLCILQAKYKKKSYRKFLNCNADIFQWELLRSKPNITNLSLCHFPPNILNFRTDYESITAYGIFYKDMTKNEVDFLYTMPSFLQLSRHRTAPVSSPRCTLTFTCPIGVGSPNSFCRKGIRRKETVSTCSIDVFQREVLACKVGAPIEDKKILEWILLLLRDMKNTINDSSVIDEILDYYGNNEYGMDDNAENAPGSFPSAIIVVTDSYKIKEYLSQEMYEP